MFERKKTIQSQSGFAAIVCVVVVSATILIIAKTASLLSLREIEMVDAESKGGEALALAEGCGEEMLRQLELDNQYEVTGLILLMGGGVCDATVSRAGEQAVIETVGNRQDYYKRILITAGIASSSITVTGWQEVNE